jgi:hypothetical protein
VAGGERRGQGGRQHGAGKREVDSADGRMQGKGRGQKIEQG